jgi:hypothetical protein
MMKKLILIAGFACATIGLKAADPIPADRLPASGSWQGNVGVSGGIPRRTTIFTTLSPGATAEQINSALASCPSDQVVFLNAGTYNLAATLLLAKNNVTLRGATDANGAPTTVLNFTSSAGIRIQAGSGGWDIANSGSFTSSNVSSGATRGSTSLNLATTPTSLQTGQILFISAPSSSTVTGGGWSLWFGSRPFTQVVKVTGKSGNTVSFTPAINADYLSTGVQAHWRSASSTIERSGIESLSLTRGGSVSGNYIGFFGADSCWSLNVKTYNVPSSTYHCYIYASHRVELRECNFSHMSNLTNSTYCILGVHSSGLLIENNVFHDCPNVFPMMGVSGSAFTYNYITNLPYDPGSWLSQIVFFHGSHSHYNLFEGNSVATHYLDSGAGSRNNLFFRQRMLGWDPANGGKTSNTNAFSTESHHDNLVVAGNVMGKAGYHTSYNQIFNVDATSNGSLRRIGNFNTVNNSVPASEALSSSDSLVNSYLYSSKPSWFGDRPWPAFNPQNPSAATDTALPAGYRFVNGRNPTGESGPPAAPTNLRAAP